MNQSLRLFILLGLILPFSLFSQNKIKIFGKILEESTQVAVPFSSIKIIDNSNQSVITGTIGNEDGSFSIEISKGNFGLVVESVGFKSKIISPLDLSQSRLELGNILVQSSSETLEEVVVQGQKASVELGVDKKIYNVGTSGTNKGSTATEILGNLPSVQVSGEGGIKLRGNSNVLILVDGKPSSLVGNNGSSGLQNLQGSMIDQIEIITNPSAKYQAEGMAGIINIVLKKNIKEGFNAAFETTVGYRPNYGGTAIINYRKNKLNFFLNYGILHRDSPGRSEIYQEVKQSDNTTNYLIQNNHFNLIGNVNNVRGGADYFFNDKTILTGSYIYRNTGGRRISYFNYLDYTGSLTNLTAKTQRKQDEIEDEPNSEYAITFKKTYDKKGKELNADLRLLDNFENSNQSFFQKSFLPNGSPFVENTFDQKSINDEGMKHWMFQLDYTNPITKDMKLETGLRLSYRDMYNDFWVADVLSDGSWAKIPNLTNYFIYNENISAGYFILSNKINKFSYQLGLRGELTDIKTELRDTGEKNPRNYKNLFPSVHLTYSQDPENQFQISYSRRIRRPAYNDLSPFMTFSDNRNFFSGNPNLNPEFADSFEIGHVKYYDQGSLSSSIFIRNTQDKILRIRSVDSNGFSTTLPQNIANEFATGLEFNGSKNLNRWWKGDLSLNLFYGKSDASNLDAIYRSETFSWFTRHTSRFKIKNSIDLQIRANYEAPQNTPQGKMQEIKWIDFSASKDIMKGDGTITLNIIDVFSSRKMRYITQGDIFYTKGFSQFRLTQFNLTFNYRIKTTKQEAKQRRSAMDEM
ncbi:MAG: hypothetical protein RIR51_1693 [Bacteroidota bacterium]